MIHCEYIPEFASVPATGRVKLRGKLLSHAEGGKSVTVVDCQLLSVRKPFSDKLNDSGED